MAPQFGNFLSRKKAKPEGLPEQSVTPPADPLAVLANQSINLSRAEIEESQLELSWDRLEEEKLFLRIALIEGLLEGAPRIAATKLCDIAPVLFGSTPPSDALIHLRLAPIVRQLGNLLPEAPEPAEIIDQSFETPFRREAEIELARIREKQKPRPLLRPDPARNLFPQAKDSISDEIDFDPSERPQMPLEILRKQKIASPIEEVLPEEEDDSAVLSKDLTRSSPPPTNSQITEPLPVKLPEVKLLPEKKLSPVAAQVVPKRSLEEGVNRRAAIERLQELFLSEEELDGPRVTEELLKLPKILGALVLRDQALLGCNLPEGFDPGAALTLNRFLEELVQFIADFGAESFSSLTISAREQITLVSHRAILVLVIHHGRLVPGVREKLVESAKALDALYAFQR
jgi:hypothetical protein